MTLKMLSALSLPRRASGPFLRRHLAKVSRRGVAALGFAAAAGVGTAAYAQTYTLTTLANFTGANGEYPAVGSLISDSSGNLYGTTEEGGSSNKGTVFEIAAGTHTLTTLAAFTGSNGNDPFGGVTIDSSGNLYGTTLYGGSSNDGTVYEIIAGSGSITTLASFNSADGANPSARPTIDSNGNLYGTTQLGGTGGDGTVYEIIAGSGTITTLAAFTGANGASPYASLTLDSSGNLYGTTSEGGNLTLNGGIGDGTVFEIAAGSGAITTLAAFNGANGADPLGGVTLDSSGNLYGTAAEGGSSNPGPAGAGTVFEIAAGSGTISTLANFTTANGIAPRADLLLDSNGNLFGTTEGGGSANDGTVFEIAAGSGAITTLANFSGTNGIAPLAGLTIDSSGDLYGTTDTGGTSGFGTVFKLTPSGAASAPEPSTFALLILGGGPTVWAAISRKKRSAA